MNAHGNIWQIIGCGILMTLSGHAAGKSDWVHPPRDKLTGLEHRTFVSRSMRIPVGFNIYLPPQYHADIKARFPVVYYLHGFNGHESSYLEYARQFDQAIRSRQLAPTILVLVNGGGTSFFSDSPDGSVMGETVVVRELVPHVDQQFRTRPEREARALHGFSMGGFGALKLACKHPDLFGAVVAYSAVLPDADFLARQDRKLFRKMFDADPARFRANDPFDLARQKASQVRDRVKVALLVGSRSEALMRNQELHRALQAEKIPHLYREFPGIKHDKDDLFRQAARAGFEFTNTAFGKR